MITHVVIMKFKPDVREEEVTDLENSFDALPEKITEIQSYEFGKDVVGSERSYDFALVAVFANLETLKQYQDHPAHLAVKQKIGKMCAEIWAVDFEASRFPEIESEFNPQDDPWNTPGLFRPA
jgi:hypothetical protein